MTDVSIRFGENDDDVVAIHQFLCLIAGPVLLGKIDAIKSITEIGNIVYGRADPPGVAIMAEVDGELVGTLGLIQPEWWYGPTVFFTDRWFFLYPAFRNRGVGAEILAQAGALGVEHGCDVVLNGHMRRRPNGIIFTKPVVISPDDVPTADWHAIEAAVLPETEEA